MNNPAKSKKHRVFLVDDHPMVREHLKGLIQQESDLEVSGEAGDAPSALSLIRANPPDLVILDLTLKRSHGLELLKDLQVNLPELPVLVLSMHEEALYAERVLRAGGMGYITKQEATADILIAIRRVLAGQIYVSQHVATRMMKKMAGSKAAAEARSPHDVLTDRELEVFQLIGRGVGTRQIAEDLHVGIKTVESYRARIREKMHLADGNELLQHAIQWLQNRGENSQVD